jgi:hypothetical protein
MIGARHSRIRIAIAFAIAVSLALVARIAPALACTPTPAGLPPPTTADKTNAAALVVEGIVTSTTESNAFDQLARVQVLRYLKGGGQFEMTIMGFGSGALCRTTVEIGDHLVFFIYGNEVNGFRVRDANDVAGPSDRLVSDIAIAAKQTPVVIQSETDVAATQAMALTLTIAPTPSPSPTAACSPASATIAQHARAADVVVYGLVSATDSAEPKTAVVEVVQYLKGDGPVRVQISGFGPASQCLSNVFVGQQWVFYATGTPTLVLAALDTAEFDPVVRPGSNVFDEVAAATGQDPLFVQSVDSVKAMLALTATASPRATLTEGAAQNFFLTLTAQPTPTPFVFPTPTAIPTPIPPTPLITVESITLVGICSLLSLLFGLSVGVFAGFTLKQQD